MSTISIIMPGHKDTQEFSLARRALLLLDPLPYEIIIVLDGSDDALRKKIEDEGLQCYSTQSQCGPAVVRNLGARQAKGEWLFFVDSDVVLAPNVLSVLTAAIAAYPRYHAFFGSYDNTPAAEDFFSQYKNLFHHYTHQHGQEDASTFWAGCGAVSKRVFEKVKGFDPSYATPSIEDIELGYRMKWAGYSIRLVKGMQCTHLKKWTAVKLLVTDFFNRAIPWSNLIWKSENSVNDLNISWSERLKTSLVFLQILLICMCVIQNDYRLWNMIFIVAAVCVLLERSLFVFFVNQRGVWFGLKALLWQWFYYFYSGTAFMIAGLRFYLVKARYRM